MTKYKNFIRILSSLKLKDTIYKIPKSDTLLVCHDVDRGEIKNYKPYSKLIDSIHEDLIKKGFKVSQFSLPFTVMEDAWSSPFRANKLFFFAYIFGGLITKFTKFFNFSSNNFIDYFNSYIFDYLLKKCNPKFIIAIGANSILCEISKKKNVPVIELLHGFGYKNLWVWENLDSSQLPSHILSLDRTSTNTFSILKNKGTDIIEIPHPWYKRFYNNPDISDLDSEWLAKPDFIKAGKKVILVSLTWGYDGDHGEHSYLSNLVENGLIPNSLINAIEYSKEDFFWCIRRHPVQYRSSKYDYQIDFLNSLTLKYSNCEWKKSTSMPLVSLFKVIDGHISMSSMTSYDAALMGIKSLLLCPSLLKGNIGENYFSDLEADGFVIKKTADLAYILNWVKNVKRVKGFTLTSAREQDWELFLENFK
jgi:hypothetical protein